MKFSWMRYDVTQFQQFAAKFAYYYKRYSVYFLDRRRRYLVET